MSRVGGGRGPGLGRAPGQGPGPGHVTGGAPPETGLHPLQSLNRALEADQGPGGGGPGAAHEVEQELKKKKILKNIQTLATCNCNTRFIFVPVILNFLYVFVS